VNERRILFETSLRKTGAALVRGAILVMLLFMGFGLFLAYHAVSFSFSVLALVWVAVCACIFGWQIRRLLAVRRNAGVYQISIDNYGLYVHSDAPDFAPSFSVPATDIARLIRKTIKHSESSDDHEYYVETKSGRRYQIQDLFMCRPRLEVMDLFDGITNYFPTLEIAEETQNF
jgi:hypothetical protein